jgi:hypothetical protein
MSESARKAFVHEAELVLEAGTDPRAPGGAVTVALCGSWDHEGPCRWPHNNEIDADGSQARFRTVFAAVPPEEDEVRARIEEALTDDPRWTIVSANARPVAADECELARNLEEGPSL